jgi:uncharacterized protein
MKHDFDARHLNLSAFARAQGSLSGSENLSRFERLLDAVHGLTQVPVRFTARGEVRSDGGQGDQVWLALSVDATVPQVCQRCLSPVEVPLQVERAFRFVASEEQAELEDEESEEDVLVLSRDFNLLELIEDELLMALPVVPKHETCPAPVKLQAQDADFDAAAPAAQKPNPFAILEQLKNKP